MSGDARTIPFTFRSIQELEAGPKWAAVFEERWPHYRAWFLREGEGARASYATSVRMLRAHMPELLPAYERLVELAGGGDLAARMLSLYRPPPFLAACSQGAWTSGSPTLVRTYDYAPSRFEGLIWHQRLLDRRVIGMGDCLWGLLDGMNDDGLAVSLTFGGRRVLGDGFGIPIVLRYLLETCGTVAEGRAALARLPTSLAHNVTLVDRGGEVVTAYLSPDREPVFRTFPVATNHQGTVEWPEQARVTGTLEREARIVSLLEDPTMTAAAFADAFLEPPLYSTVHDTGFGTLYTAAYRPAEGTATYRWPGFTWVRSFEAFEEAEHTESLVAGAPL